MAEDIKQSRAELGNLQKWLSEEFKGGTDEVAAFNFEDAFVPLTSGLGFLSSKTERPSYVPGLEKAKNHLNSYEKEMEPGRLEKALFTTRMKSSPSLTRASQASSEQIAVQESLTEEEVPVISAPQFSPPSWVRRGLSSLMDQVIVFSLWSLAAIAYARHFVVEKGMNRELLQEISLQQMTFVKIAIGSVIGMWLLYFVVCFALFERTLGMWIWGIEIHYDCVGSARALRRFLRISWSVIFYGTGVPLILLGFQYKRRNLLDWLTGTELTVPKAAKPG